MDKEYKRRKRSVEIACTPKVIDVRGRLAKKTKVAKKLQSLLNIEATKYIPRNEWAQVLQHPEVISALYNHSDTKYFVAQHFAHQYLPLAFKMAIDVQTLREQKLEEHKARMMKVLAWSYTFRKPLLDHRGAFVHIASLKRNEVRILGDHHKYTASSIRYKINFRRMFKILPLQKFLSTHVHPPIAAIIVSMII